MSEQKKWDAIVVGAGPAGCAASTTLAQHGRKVLVLEKEKFPRYHIGESLIRPHSESRSPSVRSSALA